MSSENLIINNICVGCLSIGRKLSSLEDEHKKIFLVFLEPMLNLKDSLTLCWECMTLINKLIRFKKQVQTAADNLHNVVCNKPNSCNSLSRLQWSQTECVKHEPTELVGEYMFTQTVRMPIKVKQEEDGCPSFKYYADYVKNGDNCNDYDLKTAVNIDVNSDTVCDTENFCESDDEPLALKPKTKIEATDDSTKYITKKRRKKKEFEDGKGLKVRRRARGGRGGRGGSEGPRAGVLVNKKATRKLQQLNMTDGQVELVSLSWEQVEEERQKALLSESFTRLEYKCYDCVLGFNHRVKLENHAKKHDPSSGTEECQVCKVRCKDVRALEAHTRRHRVRWRCTRCGAAWSRAAVAADHCARAHGAVQPTHLCSVCPHVAPTLGKLRVHAKIHGERQKCEICGKTFKDRSSLRTHLFIHKGEKEYACPSCHKLFLFKKAMEVHMVTHLESAHLYCHECDLTFKNRMSYYGHMKYNLKHIDPAKLKYECELCDKKFAKAARLEEHKAAIHLKVTPFSCSIPGCNFACSSRPVLRTHTRMIHRNARAIRNHVCDTCGKAYTTKKSLEGHIRAHTGERPFHCLLCPSAFGYEAALYNHNKLVHRKGKITKAQEQIVNAPGPSWDVPIDNIAIIARGDDRDDS